MSNSILSDKDARREVFQGLHFAIDRLAAKFYKTSPHARAAFQSYQSCPSSPVAKKVLEQCARAREKLESINDSLKARLKETIKMNQKGCADLEVSLTMLPADEQACAEIVYGDGTCCFSAVELLVLAEHDHGFLNLDAVVEVLNDDFASVKVSTLRRFEGFLESAHEQRDVCYAHASIILSELGVFWNRLEYLPDTNCMVEVKVAEMLARGPVGSWPVGGLRIGADFIVPCERKRPSYAEFLGLNEKLKNMVSSRTHSNSGAAMVIRHLWELLDIPELERCDLNIDDLSPSNCNKLETEKTRLLAFQQERLRERYDCYLEELSMLWSILDTHPNARAEFNASASGTEYSLDGLHIVALAVARLRPMAARAASLRELIDRRTSLIQQMRDFEVEASDPARLFASSFQLVSEEKFRKTAYPNLLAIEEELRLALLQYKHDFLEDFRLDRKSYHETLECDIAKRYVNETVFEFDHCQNSRRHKRGEQRESDSNAMAASMAATTSPSSSRRGSVTRNSSSASARKSIDGSVSNLSGLSEISNRVRANAVSAKAKKY